MDVFFVRLILGEILGLVLFADIMVIRAYARQQAIGANGVRSRLRGQPQLKAVRERRRRGHGKPPQERVVQVAVFKQLDIRCYAE
ncbi:MAG: hypothetical protein BWX80_03393 [Candidatus Hydrogenedentes bacterium ADurb.Bin101]|nr:MAG: hypothetical protein BWX80_03393 [Candidatus Hydrogenedentes bacterium ADurb.Bin101]